MTSTLVGTAGTVIVMFTDLVGSTELRVRLGEERADELRRVHDDLLAAAVERGDGQVVKGTGDGIMAVFGSATGAVAAAVAAQRSVATYNAGDDALAPLHVRVGLSAGDVSREGGDYFGTPVIEAARLCDASGTDRILAADLVRVLTHSRGGHRFGPARPMDLKGLPHPVDACEVWWGEGDGEGAAPREERADRAAASDSAGASGLRVRVFGAFEIEGVDTATLASRKARQLLRLLAVARGAPVGVDRIVDALWGDAVPAKPNDQVSVLVSRLRHGLGADAIVRTDAGYALTMSWLDLVEFDSLAADAEQRLTSGSAASARAAAGAALRLARGPLLADEADAPWADEERFAVQRRVGRVTVIAAEAELDAGEAAAAAALAERALELDPYDEVALRLLMRAHARAARPASALAAYARVRERLRDDLGVSPSAETEALHEELLLEPDTGSEPPGASDDGDLLIGSLEHAPLAGRAEALRQLDEALEQALAEGVRFVVVEGESGIGKSTLLDVWAAAAVDAGVPVLRGRCDEVSRQLPLQAVLDALDAALAGLEPAAADALLTADADVLLPLLGRGHAQREPEPSGLAALGGSGSAQAVLFAALVGLTDRLVARRGGVLVIDDLHFAGESTGEWLRFLQRRAHGRLLVVAATRPEGKPVLHPDVTISLGPLDLAAAVELVGEESRAAELLARSGGHPLLLVELSHADDTEVPASIRDAAADRLRQMGDAGATIQTAAVLAEEVDLDLLADVSRRSPIDVLDDVEQGVAHRFLDESGAAIVFRHALVRDALVSGVSTARRSLLHREAANVLARRRDAVDPLEVARHARLGGERELAATMLGQAAAHATHRHDGAEALRLLDEAIALHDDCSLRVQRGLEHLAAAEFDAAIVDAQVAQELGGGARALELLGWSRYYLREMDAARIAADEGAARADDPALKASCLILAGRVLQAEGDLKQADERMTLAESLVDVANLPVVTVWVAGLRVQQSRAAEALRLADRGLLQPGALEHPFAVTHAHFTKAHALAELGRPDEALRVLDELDHEITTRHAVDRYVGRSNNWRGWILRYLGAFDEALECNVRSFESAIPLGLNEPLAHSLLDRADGALLTGDLDGAAVLLGEAAPYDDQNHVMRWRHALRRQLLTARLSLGTADWDRAEELSAAVVQDGEHRGVERYVVLGSLVGLLARAGRGDRIKRTDVERPVGRLPVVAGSEAWWWQAQLAGATGSDELRDLARSSVAAMAAKVSGHRDDLERFASEVLP